MDYNKTLGLSSGATEDEIKAAYKALAQKYNPDAYEAGPLREEAEEKMNSVNEAFDALMGNLRTGNVQGVNNSQGNTKGQLDEIREMISRGNADDALARLHAIPNGNDAAEWNFLVGSAYYYKGWLGDAMRYFEAAARLDPTNREYEAALRNMRQSSNGNMNGNPYGNQYGGRPQAGAMGCNCCDMCSAMICMDMCCGCGNGC